MKTSNAPVATGGIALALAFALSGCAPATVPGSSASPGAVGTWGTEAQGEPNLTLAEDGSVSGTDGCNRLMGSWTQEGTTIEFGEIASTMMFCEGVDTWLLDVSTATIDGTTLRVMDADGAEIGTLARR